MCFLQMAWTRLCLCFNMPELYQCAVHSASRSVSETLPREWLRCVIIVSVKIRFPFFKVLKGPSGFLPVSQPLLNLSKCRIMSSGKKWTHTTLMLTHSFVHSFISTSIYLLNVYYMLGTWVKFWDSQDDNELTAWVTMYQLQGSQTVLLKIKTFFFTLTQSKK